MRQRELSGKPKVVLSGCESGVPSARRRHRIRATSACGLGGSKGVDLVHLSASGTLWKGQSNLRRDLLDLLRVAFCATEKSFLINRLFKIIILDDTLRW